MKVVGFVTIEGATVGELVELLSKFSGICKVSGSDGKVVVDINYTRG